MLRTLSLRHAISQRTRLVSNRRPEELLARDRRTKIILLFRKIEGFIKHDPESDSENIIRYIDKELENMLPNARSPQVVYERVITFLVGRQYTHEAALLYERMDDKGLMASDVLDAKMLALALAFPQESTHLLILRLSHIIVVRQYTENDFSRLLKTLTQYGVDRDIVCTLVEVFVTSRGPDYIIRPRFLAYLLGARIRSGDVDGTFEVLAQFSGIKNLNRAARASAHLPYIEVLAALRDTRTCDVASVNRLMGLMDDQGIRLNLPTFNILLSRHVRLRNRHAAVGIYSLIKQMRTPLNISPDSYTFASMFLLYRVIRRSAARRQHRKNPSSPFPPRALYRDFMIAVKPKFNARRIVPSSNLMNVVLRAFLYQRDYAGAFVVLSSFPLFNVPLDHRTYYHVIKHVVRRIWHEVRKGRKHRRKKVGWSTMFLGVPDCGYVKLDEALVRNLFAFVSQDTFFLVFPFYASHGHKAPTNVDGRHKLPSMEMMHSTSLPDPEDFYYDPVPLKRILRRAILAKLRMADNKAGPAEVSKAIADAKVEMLPKIPQRKPRPASESKDV